MWSTSIIGTLRQIGVELALWLFLVFHKHPAFLLRECPLESVLSFEGWILRNGVVGPAHFESLWVLPDCPCADVCHLSHPCRGPFWFACSPFSRGSRPELMAAGVKDRQTQQAPLLCDPEIWALWYLGVSSWGYAYLQEPSGGPS